MSSFHDLLFRTDSVSKWGDGLGRNLQPEEIDDNFWILLQLYLALEANPTQPFQIDEITVENNQMTITLNDGVTSFGPFTLPVAAFRWRDNWTPDTAYVAFDLFNEANGLYMVLRAHTSEGTFDPDAFDVSGPYYQLLIAYPVAFDIGFFFPGLPGTGISDDKPLFSYLAARSFYLKAALPDTVAAVETPFELATDFPIYKNGDEIGSIIFEAGASVGTFSFTEDVQFSAGDKLKVMKPVTVDDEGADLNVTFAATKGVLEAPSSS